MRKRMTVEEYVDRLKRCPRAEWVESGLDLRTLKRHSRRVRGWITSRAGDKVVTVEDGVLHDSYALGRLAVSSTEERLSGVTIWRKDEIKEL